MPTPLAALAGGVCGGLAGLIVGYAFARLPRAGFAAATWIVSWLVAFALQSITWFLGGSQGIVVTGGPTAAQHYELALVLTGLAALGYVALARAPFGLRLAAAREREPAALALGVPVFRLRATAIAASGTVAGVAGALAVQLAGVGDPAQYGPYLSFKLFVVVLIGGALAPLGAPAGVLVLGVLSLAADAVGLARERRRVARPRAARRDHAARRRLARLGRNRAPGPRAHGAVRRHRDPRA